MMTTDRKPREGKLQGCCARHGRRSDYDLSQRQVTRALIIERFDRLRARDGRLIRLPQEDCCEALSVPPTRKYQNEGGPGIVEICDLLTGSDEPQHDRADFLKAVILFWLIGATEGHAKNFSIALMPGGRFRMTPIYDVLTVQPSLDAGALQINDMSLAMRAGKGRHCRVADFRAALRRDGAGRGVFAGTGGGDVRGYPEAGGASV